MADAPNDLSDDEKALFDAYADAWRLAEACGRLRTFDTPEGHDALGYVVNCLMTEFWDHGFSQTEIRNAFADAMADMNRYAAGEERRR